METQFISQTPEMTKYLGSLFAQYVKAGDCIPLSGGMGAGKTTFVQGIATGLGVSDETEVTSPTFTLVNRYLGRIPIYHVDLYRLGDAAELDDLELDDILDGDGVVFIEWPNISLDLIPETPISVDIHWDLKQLEERVFTFKTTEPRFTTFLEKLKHVNFRN